MITIQHSDGSIREGVLLSLQGGTARIAGKGSDDVLEFRLVQDNWVSESCDVVTFQFPLAIFEAIGMMPGFQDRPVAAHVAEFRAPAPCDYLN